MFANFDALKKNVQGKGVMTIAVAAAEDHHTLEALKELGEHIEVRFFLVGDRAGIMRISEQISLKVGGDNIVDADGEEDSAAKAVALCAEGTADILMKGKLQTSTLLKAVLNKETGIRQGGLMSHLAVLESPAYHKLLFITDGGINPSPDAAQKQAILENSVSFLHRLGYDSPNVAVLAAVETVSDKMPETADAAALAQKNAAGEISGCCVEGPLSFDLAVSQESARIKGVDTKLAGKVDLLLMPNIASGNIMTKALMYMGGAKMAGCVLGAKVPIVLTSRGATAEEKLLSFLLCLAAA
ncbi:MAG: bifunctional enoyl-CoA hydratase/phosphate acetyltransferase [Defluviitaleaceae bacterium]|nr:bifunctional enoyl-CoA hydratase/phosphate acetyltransferase [Defluviitaleaceae bacterium]